ncbi:MAG: DUF4397 domain-containing protein [Chloroflexi bacterium]|nr:DUF4397 domain-containing protein [Chloroflexota bacterium]
MVQPLLRGVARLVTFLLIALGLVVALLPVSSPPVVAQEETAQADATLRVMHAAPGAPSVDVLLDGQTLLADLASGTASSYATLTAEEHRLQIVPTGQSADAAVVDETIDAAPGQAYLLAVFGLLNELDGAVYAVDLGEIEPGTARVRLINFSPDAGDIDLLETGGDEWFGNVGLGEASDYQELAPGTYSGDVRGDDDRVLETIPDLTFAETRVYDVVVVGQVADDSLAVHALVTTVSPPCAEVLDLTGASSDACLRLVHAAPDAPPVDLYVNDAQIAQGLAFGTATEYVTAPSGGGRGVRVAAEGTPVEEAIIDTPLDFDPGQAYELLVTGGGDDLELTITGTDLRPLAAGQARLRLIHASPEAGAVDIGVAGSEENLFEGIDFREATEYVVLDAGEYALEVRPGGEDMTVALQSEATLEEGVTYDLVALGRPEDQTLTLLALMAAVPIQIGDVATPAAASEDAVAATVVPQAIEDVEASPTPVG